MKFFYYMLLMLGLGNCTPTESMTDEVEYPQTYGKLKIVWRTPFKNDQLYASKAPAIFEDKVVFSNFPAFGTETFIAYDADTGKKKFWEWADYIGTSDMTSNGTELPVTHENVLCITPSTGAIGVDMRTGTTLWKNEFATYGGNTKIGSSIIKVGEIGDPVAFIKLIDLKTGTDRTVFYTDTISTPFCVITQPSFQIQSGDTILYFVLSELFQQPDLSLLHNGKLCAYNITTQQLVWSKPYNPTTFLIKDDKIYTFSEKLVCMNIFSGEELWSKPLPEKSGGYLSLFEDKMIITDQGINSFIHAYSLADGTPLWKHPFQGNTSEPLYYKGIMYFTCGSDGLLWAIRVSDGEIIWKERCPDKDTNSSSHWSFGINADPVRDKLYVASFTGAFCIEPAN